MYQVLTESIVSNPNKRIVYANDKVIKESSQKFINNLTCDSQQENILIRAESDKFDYKVIQLENGIRIMLISDPSYKELPVEYCISNKDVDFDVSEVSPDDVSDNSSDKISDDDFDNNQYDKIEFESFNSNGEINRKTSAIVVAVKVGSIHDPKEIQGMAHMLEHLLTMGSKSYPAKNYIDDYLVSRGGYQNAHTEIEHTIFEFKVHPTFVPGALNLIGHAFAYPLLRKKTMEKEIKPIDTEFIEASNDDDNRVEVLLSHLADSDHPVNKFMWGNKKSLIEDPKAKNIDVHQELISFYRSYYKPENMVVVVQSQESMENLECWTSKVFSFIKSTCDSKGDDLKKIDSLPFMLGEKSRFTSLYYIESINSGTRLLINWCLASVLGKYLVAPNDYWASLIGYEGKGSLISVLRSKNLAIELFTDSESFCWKNNSFFCIFKIDIHLTEKGASNIDEVIQLLFEFLTVLRKFGAQEYYYREKQIIEMNAFNKKPEKNPISYSIDLAKNLLYLPLEHVLTGHSLYYHFDKEVIDKFGENLLPQNANFIILDKNLKGDLEINIEPWMKIKYQRSEVPKKWIDDTIHYKVDSKYFHYPKPNRFISKNFELLSNILPPDCPERKHGELPVKIIDEPRMVVWHKTDFKYGLPDASINIHILSPFNENCLENVALNIILQEYLTIVLQEDTYDAYEAHLKWELARTVYGVFLNAIGFSEKLSELVFIVLKRFLNIDISSELLTSVKKDTIKQYRNENQDSDILCKETFSKVLLERHYSHFELIPKIEAITKENLIEYIKKFLSNISFEVLIQGNISIKETIDFSKELKSMFNLASQTDSPLDKTKLRVAKIPPGTNRIRVLTLAKTNKMSYIEVYQQLRPFELRSKCYQSLFVEMINEQCFHVLRTCEGLGYWVGCSDQDMFGILGFSIFVSSNSNKFDCTFVETRIRNFMENYCKEYIQEKLTEEKFSQFVSSQITKKLSPDLSLGREVKKHWNEIIIYDYCFDRDKKEVAQLQQASLGDFKNWAIEHIFLPWDKRRMFTVQVVGNGNKALDECLTFSSKPICQELICPNEESQTIQLLKSKEKSLDNFITNILDFKQSLEFYPPQASQRDYI